MGEDQQMNFTVDTVKEARERIRNYVTETPLLRMEALDAFLGCQVYLKLENMQKIGAFKFRGAMNKIQKLTAEELAHGIVAASSSNHGKAIAYGAKTKGAKATIIMPNTAPKMKVEAIKGVNANVKVMGAEPSVLPRYSVSLEKGEPTMVPMPEVKSVADALVSNRPGIKCFPVVRDCVDGFAAVDDTYMLKAMKMLLMEGKILAEPSSCIGMGAVMQGNISVSPEDKVCFVISGGNLGFDQLELLGGVKY